MTARPSAHAQGWARAPAGVRTAAAVCAVAAVFLGFGAVWISGYAFVPADGITRSEGVALTAGYVGAIVFLAVLARRCSRAQPGTLRRTRRMALVGTVVGGVLLLAFIVSFVLVIVLRLYAPVPWVLMPDPVPGTVLGVPSLVAYLVLRQAEAQPWPTVPAAGAVP